MLRTKTSPVNPGGVFDKMTLDEKIAQMTWVNLLDVITDRHTLTFSGEKASVSLLSRYYSMEIKQDII